MAWLLWTLATAVPVLSFAAWALAAWRMRRARLLVTAGIYMLWPIVAMIASTVLAAVVFDELHGTEQLIQGSGKHSAHSMLMLWVAVAVWLVSLVNAQLEWRSFASDRQRHSESLQQIDNDAIPGARPYWICVLFWSTLGWAGAHRFYTGRWITGLIYLGTLGLMGAGWAADLFLLRRMLLSAPQLNGVQREVQLAPWASEEKFGTLDFVSRLAFFLIAPFLFVQLCVYFHHLELLAVLVLAVVVCGLLGNLERIIGRLDLLEKIPLTRPAVGFLRDMHQFYYETRPRPFWHYVFWPIAAPIDLWTSPNARREMKLYGKFLITLYVMILVNQARGFSTDYQYMSIQETAAWCLFHLIFATIVTATFIVPVVTTSFSLNLAGKQTRLKTLSVLVLATTLPLAGLSFYMVNHLRTPTWVSWMMLESRIKNPMFRHDLQVESEIFLRHYLGRIPRADEQRWAAYHAELTNRYRTHIQSVVDATEAKSFEVRVVNDSESLEPSLAIVEEWHLGGLEKAATLFVMSSDGRFFSGWERLPPRASTLFAAIAKVHCDHDNPEYKIAQRSVTADTRLYDVTMDYLWQEAGPLETSVNLAHPTFQPMLSAGLRQTLQGEGFDDVNQFRIFGWDDGDHQWLCVRDSQYVWMLVNDAGQFIQQWDKPNWPKHSIERTYLEKLEFFDPIQSLDLRYDADRSLAKDLVREHTHVFLTDAIYWRREHDTPDSLTRSYQDFIADIIPGKQRNRFRVVELPEAQGWLGVVYDNLPLFAADDHGGFFLRGASAPQPASRFLNR